MRTPCFFPKLFSTTVSGFTKKTVFDFCFSFFPAVGRVRDALPRMAPTRILVLVQWPYYIMLLGSGSGSSDVQMDL